MRLQSLKWLVLLCLGAFVASCDATSPTDQAQTIATENIMAEAHAKIGMPDIVHFTERRHARDLLALRDKKGLTTFTYVVDADGNLHKVCRSSGYGLPMSVQYTNPEKFDYEYYSSNENYYGYTLPQPDPNGLFMPSGLSATYVMCLDEKQQIQPIYSEPNLIVSPFELQAIGSYLFDS